MKQLRNSDSLLENDELDYYHQNLIQSASAMTAPASTIADLPELVAEIQNSRHIVMTKPLPQVQIDPSSIPTVLRRNASFDSCVLQRNERRVLVIYTGGTIGMVRSARGALVPLPNMLEKTVRKFPHLHDEKYAKMRFGDTNEQPVVLPEMNDDKTRIIYTIYEYDPLLDSSNMTMDDWIRIAQDVKDNYEKFDGFVILHGTDTMAYTAPALSFMMDSLGKSVVITGSQIPLFETRSDGRDNFLGALILAGSYVIPEVTVYFGHRLFRGNRISKVSSDSLNAFDSPNLQPLATMGINIQVNYHNIFRPTEILPFAIHTSLNRNVGLLRLFPSITVETVRVFLQAPTLGVVLQTYGAGNFPTNRKDLLKELEDAAARGVLIVNCTQCGHGSVSPIYETGHMIQNMGIIPGWDMTPEAALTKLSYVLGRSDWSLEKKREMLQANLKGELTKCGNKLHQNYFPSTSPSPVIGGSYQNGKSAEFVVDCSRPSNYGCNDVMVGPDVVQNVVRVVSTRLGLNSPEEQVGIKKLLTPSLSCALMTQVGNSNNNHASSCPQVIVPVPGPSSSSELVPVVGSPNSKFLENLFGHSVRALLVLILLCQLFIMYFLVLRNWY